VKRRTWHAESTFPGAGLRNFTPFVCHCATNVLKIEVFRNNVKHVYVDKLVHYKFSLPIEHMVSDITIIQVLQQDYKKIDPEDSEESITE
jgi:hypothetical protein